VQVGDIVKHKHGIMVGAGIVLSLLPASAAVRVAWTAHGETKLYDVATLFLEVISEGR